MKFNVSSKLQYEVLGSSTIILNIHALKSQQQQVLEEKFWIDPYCKWEELLMPHSENRFIKIEIEKKTNIAVEYMALVDTSYKMIPQKNQKELSVNQFSPEIFSYLYPSRYCQSDMLYRLANNMFGKIQNSYDQVVALTDWIHENVAYLSGSTDSQTSAYDTVTQQAGVCRDFAHLGIALCRALTIPARYFTGYAYQLNPPDFHACFEAYLNGQWILFDPTKLAPLNGMVKIATGRDAADTAIANKRTGVLRWLQGRPVGVCHSR
ncbi:MAG: transglutaminase family protein [Sphingobacteriales bacterium]|nr:MAG: transglutaminase family protein [Sphingobacteriales bacterium]